MKLLAVCDTPTLNTGFARVAQNLLRRWAPHFDRIDIWGIGHNGYPGKPGVAERIPWTHAPFVLYPASYGAGPWYALERFQSLLNHIMQGDYTHLWIMQDHFLLAMHDFPKHLKDACARKGVRSFYYCPVDGVMDPDWVAIVEAVDCPVAYTRYGWEQIVAHTGILSRPGEDPRINPIPNIRVIPHGVDLDVYHPIEDRERLRMEKTSGWIKPTDVLLLNVNANQRRKDVVRSLQILKALHERGHPEFKLLLHMAETGPDDISIESAAAQLGLVRGEHWDHTGSSFLKGFATLPESELNELYNIADIYLTTPLGEGWGLGITEALAAGCPVAIPDNTACSEIASEARSQGMEHRFCILPLEKHGVMLAHDNARIRHRVDVEAAVDRLLEASGTSRFIERQFIRAEVAHWLDWNRIANEWLGLFQSVTRAPAHYYLEYGGGLGDVFHQMFHRGSYNVLRDLGLGESATVVLRSHNPFVKELFEAHPKRSQFEVMSLGYVDPAEDARQRREYALPRAGALDRLPERDKDVEFHPLPLDLPVLAQLSDVLMASSPPHASPAFLVIAAGAGLPDRNIPNEIISEILGTLGQTMPIVVVGRRYQRHNREEVDVAHYARLLGMENVIDLIDHLSVPATALLVSRCTGLITAHSALNLLGWHLGKPQLLLYPHSVFEHHIKKRDQWAFGIDNGKTVHCEFGDWNTSKLAGFMQTLPNRGFTS